MQQRRSDRLCLRPVQTPTPVGGGSCAMMWRGLVMIISLRPYLNVNQFQIHCRAGKALELRIQYTKSVKAGAFRFRVISRKAVEDGWMLVYVAMRANQSKPRFGSSNTYNSFLYDYESELFWRFSYRCSSVMTKRLEPTCQTSKCQRGRKRAGRGQCRCVLLCVSVCACVYVWRE